MAHQKEVEKSKYRNWVRGGLAYKYLKQGIEGFADDVVQQEHNRILQNINHTPGLTCNQCSVGSFRPIHTRTGMVTCPRSLRNCSCLNRKKKPCPNNVCDAIMEEILDSHDSNGSQPPTPSWKNSYIQKWSSDPWEVAKCFIHSPGYSDKASASDIDAAGLLHVFINNINLQSYLSCEVPGDGTDIFSKTLNRRNAIFHSSTMELEDNELNQCIDDIIAILEDEKQLKQRPDAQRAVEKLNQLKLGSFIITTNTEVEVCRDAMISITNRSNELKQMIQDTKDDIDQKKTEVEEAFDDKTRKALDGALKQLEKQNDSQLQTMKKAIELLSEGLENVQRDYTAVKLDISLIQERLTQIENSIAEIDSTKDLHKKRLEFVEQKHALQSRLLERYEKGYFNTWISPLKTHENEIDVNELYVTPNMVVEKKTSGTASTKTLSGPGTTKGLSENYTFDDNRRQVPSKHSAESQFTTINRYRDIFQTGSIMHQKIYIIGDVGTGKSTLSKMMINNWCRAVRGDNNNPENRSDTFKRRRDAGHDEIQAYNISEMSKFNFLFVIPLQRMSGFSSDIKEMIKVFYKDVMTDELLDEIFNQESERCLVIADGLDEWTPPKHAHSPLHVSYGIPVGDGVKNATLITLSRPSARGILNMRSSEYDQKITLMGVHEESLYTFTEKYMMVNPNRYANINFFLEKIKDVNLVHLEKTPLILQQLIWMFCLGNDIGKSVSDIYSNVINIMISWSEKKGEEDTTQSSVSADREFKRIQLPVLLRRFPRCEENKRILILLGKLSFKVLTDDAVSTFGRSALYHCGLSRDDIGILIRSGILVEYNCFDPTIESTYLSFIHTSYLEFFAAVFISSHYSKEHLTHAQKPELESRTVLTALFMKYKSAQDILQLSNLLKMVCGLSPFLLEDISSHISDNMMIGDISMIRYRNKHLQSNYSDEQDAPWHIQNLIKDCFEECRMADQLAVILSDVIIGSVSYNSASVSEPFLQTIISSSVLSLKFTQKYHRESITWIGKFHQLQFIRIDSIFSCTTCEKLSSSLKEIVLLKSLTLNDNICDNYTCEGHIIDLRRHNQLQSIHLKCCTVMLSSLVNTESLETVSITNKQSSDHIAHTVCQHLSSSLSQAVSLNQLILKDIICYRYYCAGHAIDLPKQDQLQSIEIEDCSYLLGSVGNVSYLGKLFISLKLHYKTPHAMCERLSSLVSQAVSLKEITLKGIICDRGDCEGHVINFPQHDQLLSIEIGHCSCLLGSIGNARILEKFLISWSYNFIEPHVMYQRVSSPLSEAVSLKELTLQNMFCDTNGIDSHTINLSRHHKLQSLTLSGFSIYFVDTTHLKSLTVSKMSDATQLLKSCYNSKLEYLSMTDIGRYTSEINSVVHTLQHLEELILDGMDINENALTVTAGMQNIKIISLNRVCMSLQTWRSLVDSVLEQQHVVCVTTHQLSIEQAQEEAFQQYVKQHKGMFQMFSSPSFYFSFHVKHLPGLAEQKLVLKL